MQDQPKPFDRKKQLIALLEKLWNELTSPLYNPETSEARRKGRLISSLLAGFCGLAILGLFFIKNETWNYLLAILFAGISLYFLARSKWYLISIYATLITLSIAQFWIIISTTSSYPSNTEGLILRLVLIFLLGISLIPLRKNLILMGMNLIAVAILPLVAPQIDSVSTLSAVGFLLTCAIVITLGIGYRDVSEAERRKEVLEEKIFSDEIINGLPGVFFLCDSRGGLIRWNEKLGEITGITHQQLAQESILNLTNRADHKVIEKIVEEIHITGRGKGEIRLLGRDNRETIFYFSAVAIMIQEQNCFLGFGIDSTDFKRSEEARRALVEYSLQGLAIQQNGRIVFSNPAYSQILGYSIDELYALSPREVSELVFVEDRNLLKVRMEAALTRHQSIPRYELRLVCKNGAIRWVDVSMSAINYQNGIALQIASVDITDRKLMEVEQARLIWELEAKNAELERFTYTVSHDLKSPLITIRGFVGFLEKDALSNNTARIKADVQRILEATDKMQNLLGDLLALSRVGHVINQPVSIPFDMIAKDAASRVEGQIRNKGIQVRIDGSLPNVYVDRERIVEVVQNLIDNACKFIGDQPDPRIHMGMNGTDQDGKYIFFIRDNGIGIDPQFHERIFGLFNKLDPESEGTGVGLALVKRIIDIHNGRIWVESSVGQGTTFCFTLPGSEIHASS